MLITYAQKAYHELHNKFRIHIFGGLDFGSILHQKSISNKTTPKLFFLYRYFLRKIFPSVAVVLAVNFAANFWRQAVLAQF